MQQYSAARAPERTESPSLALAFSPLAFPMIVTPYGIAAVTILMALAPTTQIRLTPPPRTCLKWRLGSSWWDAARLN